MYVFFFKQKTAYEMRISDWSSDVCSSDLLQEHRLNRFEHDAGDAIGIGREVGQVHDAGNGKSRASRTNCLNQLLSLGQGETTYPVDLLRDHYRSEEHTSELQSLMRNSYAVFCLKKQNQETTPSRTPHAHRLLHIERAQDWHNN